LISLLFGVPLSIVARKANAAPRAGIRENEPKQSAISRWFRPGGSLALGVFRSATRETSRWYLSSRRDKLFDGANYKASYLS
jgi:hypothetical protein